MGVSDRYSTEIVFVLFLVGSFGLFVPDARSGDPPEEPYCADEREDVNHVCDVENFNGLSLGSYGKQFVSPNGFEFELYESPSTSDLEVTDAYQNLGRELFFGCYSTRIILPNERDFVTFQYIGEGSNVEFIAVNGNGTVLDVEEKSSNGSSPTVVSLHGEQIQYVYLHHLDNNVCDVTCGEPYISEIKACTKVQP